MKSDKQTNAKTQKPATGAKKSSNKKSNDATLGVDTRASATGRTKATAGHGLANEGTITSYEEERER